MIRPKVLLCGSETASIEPLKLRFTANPSDKGVSKAKVWPGGAPEVSFSC